jgi:hypothetical protein
LTTKFTQHTGRPSAPAFSFWLLAFGLNLPLRLANFMAPACSSHAHSIARVAYTSRQ